jgi:hypothetical protein
MCVFFARNTLMIKKCTPFPCMVSEYESYDFSNQNCILPICINEIFYNILNNGISLKFHQIYIYIYIYIYILHCFMLFHAWLGLF